MTPTTNTVPAHSLARTIASASRKLDKDMNMTTLQAIDRLLRLASQFSDQWVGPSPWLVLEDCYTLPARMPVQKMLEEIEQHGAPIGIVGMGILEESLRPGVLQMLFRKDEKTRKTVEKSAAAARQVFEAQSLERKRVFESQLKAIDLLKVTEK